MTRNWVSLTGPAKHRTTTVRFRLAHRGPLVFTLEELSPACRKVASFRAQGRQGVNRIHFRARVGNRPVEPGTYRLVARRPDGRIVMRVRLVIVRGGKPSGRQLAAARRANVCPSAAEIASERSSNIGGGAPAVSGGANATDGGTTKVAAPSEPQHASPSNGGVLGVSTSLTPSPRKLPFLVLALVGLAILLLGLGALPRSVMPVAAAGALVARRRLEIATAGMATLVASLIAYLIA